MNSPREFSAAYSVCLRAHLDQRDEHTLRTAYELGRRAVASELALLDVAGAHHDAVLAAVRSYPPARVEYVLEVAGDFLVEILATYEMVKRGFADEHAAARAERRHATMVRNLSSFLTDAAHAAASPDALPEVLQLVVEHARELTGAQTAIAAVQTVRGERAEAYSRDEESPPDLSAMRALTEARRMVVSGTRSAPYGGARAGAHELTAALTSFEGEVIGALQVATATGRGFSAADEAVVAHIAQITSPTLERVLEFTPR